MDITLVAKTKEKESYQIDNMKFHFEYAIGSNFTEQEKEEIVNKYGVREIYHYVNVYSTLKRRVDVYSDDNIIYHEWNYYDFSGNFNDVAIKFGDGDFYSDNTISLHHIRDFVIERNNKINELSKELNDLNNDIIPHKFQKESNLKQRYLDKAISELKSKKLFQKYLKGTISKDVLDSIRKPIEKEYLEELEKIENRITDIMNELDILNSTTYTA